MRSRPEGVDLADSQKDLLEKCSGGLTVVEATRGMNVAIENSNRLLSDAKLLLDAGRYPTALSVAILAIEEAGKVSILRSILTASEADLKSLWKDYRSHRAKNVAWILPDLVKRGARTLLGLREAVDKDAEHTFILDILKQLGFYTDFVGYRNWSSPEIVIDKELAESIWQVASILCKDRSISEKENEIWLKHLGVNSQYGMTKAGLEAYFLETIENGLLDQDKEKVMKFIYGGISIK